MTSSTGGSPFSERIQSVLSNGGTERAMLFKGRWHTWQDFHADWQAVTSLLEAGGVAADAVLGLVARTRVQHAAVITGAFGAGRTLSLVYAMQSPSLIAKDIMQLGAAAVIADLDDWTPETIAAARAAGSVGIAISNTAPGQGPRVRPVTGLERVGSGIHRSAGAGHDIEVLTSGTTGAPKRIRLPVAAFTRAVASWTLGDNSLSREINLLCHQFGNIGGLLGLANGAHQGSQMVLLEKFNVPEFVDAVSTYKVKSIGLTAAMYRMILQANVPREALASVEFAFGGADPLEHETIQRFEATYGFPLLWGYGATEFAGTVITWTPALRREFGHSKPGSIGRPLVGADVRVVDAETGVELPRGHMGNLEARIDALGPDWIRSTDLATMDVDGFVFLHGRGDRAINRGGFKILPERVAAVLRMHPAVLDAAVVGLRDPVLGEVPAAAIEKHPDAAPPSAAELEQLVRDHLPSHHVPTRFVVVDELPRTASLKVRVADLNRLFEAG